MNSNFFNYQYKKLLQINFFLNSKKNYKNFHYNQTWSISIGLIYLLKNFFRTIKIEYYINVIKQFYLYEKSRFYLQKNICKKKYKKSYLTWYNSKNHKKNKYFDNYFRIENQQDDLLFIFIASKKIQKLPKNSIAIICDHKKCKLNFLEYFKIIFNLIFLILGKGFDNIYSVKRDNFFIENISFTLKKLDINKLYMPYEAQHWQDLVISKLYKDGIQTYGYLHSSIPAFPVEFINKKIMIKKLFVHGHGHKKILLNLNWPLNKIKVIKSLRYHKQKVKYFESKVFLPHTFLESPKNLYKYFENSLKYFSLLKINPSKLLVQNHPLMHNSLHHMQLKKKLIKKLKNYNEYNDDVPKITKSTRLQYETNKCSVFFGTTASIIESLENNVNVLHICSLELIESYNPKIWEFINVTRFEKNIFFYSLKKKNSYIVFSGKYKNFLKALKH